MKANQWRNLLEQQRGQYGKVLFTVTELAHLADTSHAALNVELSRLRRQEIVTQYAHGLYGLPGAVALDALVPAIDSHAYLTGHYALYVHNLVTQVPVVVTCFTDRRSPRARLRDTPLGRLVFTCVTGGIYGPPAEGPMAPPLQALCDYVYLCRRDGILAEQLLTFRNLQRIGASESDEILARYPSTVKEHVLGMLAPAGATAE